MIRDKWGQLQYTGRSYTLSPDLMVSRHRYSGKEQVGKDPVKITLYANSGRVMVYTSALDFFKSLGYAKNHCAVSSALKLQKIKNILRADGWDRVEFNGQVVEL